MKLGKLLIALVFVPLMALAVPTVPVMIHPDTGLMEPADKAMHPSDKSTLIARDGSGNTRSNNHTTGFVTQQTLGGTTTLTVASPHTQHFFGLSTQNVVLPVASTLALNQEFLIINDSTALMPVKSSAGNAVMTLAPGTRATFVCKSTSAGCTSAACWNAGYEGTIFAIGGVSLTIGNTMTIQGTDGSVYTMPGSNATMARTDASQTFTGFEQMDAFAPKVTAHGNFGAVETFSALVGSHTGTLDQNCTVTLIDFAAQGGYNPVIKITVTNNGGFDFNWPAAVNPVPQINQAAGSQTDLWIETTNGGTNYKGHSDYPGDISPRSFEATASVANNDSYSAAWTLTGLTAGVLLTQWQTVYLDSSSTWRLADADGSGTAPARGVVAAGAISSAATKIMIRGVARHDAWTWTRGGTLYLSKTAGSLTQTAPIAYGDYTQAIGFALTPTVVYFDFTTGGVVPSGASPTPTATATATATASPTPTATATASATATPTATATATATATSTATATATPTATTGAPSAVNQNFEGTANNGYDNSETWLSGGTVNPNYATAPAPLLGSQSLLMSGVDAYAYTSFAPLSDAWAFGYFRIRTGGMPNIQNNNGLIFGTDAGWTGIIINQTGTVRLGYGVTVSGASTMTLNENVTYYVWLHYVKGGTNTLYLDDSTTRPSVNGAGSIVLTVPDAGGFDFKQVGVWQDSAGGASGTSIIYDHIQVSSTEIGNNP